jgi:DnaJ-domain-containing protein 1
MALAANEIGIIVVGAAVGYWIVSYVLERGRSGRAGPAADERQQPDPPPSAPARWWAVLGVQPDASREDIVKAYMRRIGENDPDKVATLSEEIRAVAAKRAQEIDAAYDEALRLKR